MNRNQKQSPRFPFIIQQLVPIKKSSSLGPQNVSLLRNSKEFANIISPDKVILLEWAPKPVTGVTTHSHIPEKIIQGLKLFVHQCSQQYLYSNKSWKLKNGQEK